MAKTKDNPVETMRLDIEFANNGIILRNPDCEDEVTLALTMFCEKIYSEAVKENWHAKEHLAIGKKIYDWLVEVAVAEHADDWVSTGARLSIKAELTGRKRR